MLAWAITGHVIKFNRFYPDTEHGWLPEPTAGESVTFAGYKDFAFAVAHTAWAPDMLCWAVSEVRSGAALGFALTKSGACRLAAKNLETVTPERLEAAITEFQDKVLRESL